MIPNTTPSIIEISVPAYCMNWPSDPSISTSALVEKPTVKGIYLRLLGSFVKRLTITKPMPVINEAGKVIKSIARNCIPHGSYQGNASLINEVKTWNDDLVLKSWTAF